MSTISQVESNSAAAAAQVAETADTSKKVRVSGKTVGNPQLSETASKYYEELKKKYSNMDFILVSSDMKEIAKANAGSYANPGKLVVLIDEEKIERMATDEKFRKQYEAILNHAASGMNQLNSRISQSSANVKSYGAMFNDGGTMSFFAVVDKSLAAQKKRIEKKAAEKKEAQKTAAKKAEKKKQQEKLEEKRAEGKAKETDESEDTVTITASSVEELMRKLEDYAYASMSDQVQTPQERQMGQHIDFRM